mmetsp:Transcript_20340/g.42620  ORF Transcript_20340/g.42620 Transcript_20340/m.42620 type:complete len:168 (-) Transcript_20340:79-582(-)
MSITLLIIISIVSISNVSSFTPSFTPFTSIQGRHTRAVLRHSSQLPSTDSSSDSSTESFTQEPKVGEDGMVAPEERPPNPLLPLNDIELAAQRTALTKLEEQWRREREDEEYEAARLLGWTKQAEMYNGRFAMFFLVVGLLTEYWTGVTFPGQIEEMLRVGGFIELS